MLKQQNHITDLEFGLFHLFILIIIKNQQNHITDIGVWSLSFIYAQAMQYMYILSNTTVKHHTVFITWCTNDYM